MEVKIHEQESIDNTGSSRIHHRHGVCSGHCFSQKAGCQGQEEQEICNIQVQGP